MDETLYCRTGQAIAYFDQDVVYVFSGQPVAYLEHDVLYNYPGRALGLYDRGWVCELAGACVFFTEAAGDNRLLRPALGRRPPKASHLAQPIRGTRDPRPPIVPRVACWSVTSPAEFFGSRTGYRQSDKVGYQTERCREDGDFHHQLYARSVAQS